MPAKMPVFHPQVSSGTALSRPCDAAMLAPSAGPRRARGRVEHATETSADSLWGAIAGRLRETLSETTYDTWFAHAEPRSLGEEGLVVTVPNDFTRDWIESHFQGFVSGAAHETLGRDVLVTFAVERAAGMPGRNPSAPAAPPRERLAEIP